MLMALPLYQNFGFTNFLRVPPGQLISRIAWIIGSWLLRKLSVATPHRAANILLRKTNSIITIFMIM